MSRPNAFDKIAQMQDIHLTTQQSALEQTKRQVLKRVKEGNRRPKDRSRIWIAVAAAGFIACGVAAGYLFTTSSGTVTGQTSPSTWLVASTHNSETMTFDDGSKIVLSPRATVRVFQSAPHAVRISVEKGDLYVHVAHAENTRWLLEAGPYTVRVTGTRFNVSWDAENERFMLQLKRGSVVVTGPMLEEGKAIHAGERLAASLNEKRIEILGQYPQKPGAVRTDASTDGGEMSGADALNDADLEALPQKSGRQKTASPASGKLVSAERADRNWSQMCREGRFDDVVADARMRGLPAVLNGGSSADLMALGEALRLTRNTDLSADVYSAVRRRFAGTRHSGNAAFFLGKMAFDRHRDHLMAERWLQTYLKEAPNGAFAQDALGRLIETQLKCGHSGTAAKNARQYLNRYPQGPHADMARKATGEN